MNHTLVIPTFNRPALLARLVRYYAAEARPFHVLVLDSSSGDIATANAVMLGAFGDFVRHETFPETEPPAVKLWKGLQTVETPFVSFCADDDIVFPDGLAQALAFLASNVDHVSAHGLYLNFRQAGADIHITREYGGPSIESPFAGARVFRLFQRYESLYYGVFRTEALTAIFDQVAKLPTLHFQELFQSTAALIIGKVHRIPSIYAARQSGPAAEPDRDKWQTYCWFADDPADFLSHYLIYRDALTAFFEQHAGPAEIESFAKTLDLAHAVYFSANCPPRYFHSRLADAWTGETFEPIDKSDLFATLERTGRRRHPIERALTRAQAGLRVLVSRRRRARASTALARLNQSASSETRGNWTCHLAASDRWLAETPAFRDSFLELCRYLDAGENR